MAENMNSEDLNSEDLNLMAGPCCACGQSEDESWKTADSKTADLPFARNVITLGFRQPDVEGEKRIGGWGCFVCDLPCEGAVAFVCDPCLAANVPVRTFVLGDPRDGRRGLVEALTEPWAHDKALHLKFDNAQYQKTDLGVNLEAMLERLFPELEAKEKSAAPAAPQMCLAEAEQVLAGVRATKMLDGGRYRQGEPRIEEPLPGDFVVIVPFIDHPDPCVIGGERATRAWLAAHGKEGVDYTSLPVSEADRIGDALTGTERPELSKPELSKPELST